MIKLFAQVTKPEFGYDYDSNEAYALVKEFGKEYLHEVHRIDVGRSSSDVHLVGSELTGRNVVNFSFFISEDGKQVKPYDFIVDELKLPQIRQTYINMLIQ